ncbi:Spy/CpxP family protein refolding chaperone [Moraxella macacae]|nr:Spy/CpxP family protein refolding chaperone [Moraxella macacae]
MKLLNKTGALTASLFALTLATVSTANAHPHHNHENHGQKSPAMSDTMSSQQMPTDGHHHKHDSHKTDKMQNHHTAQNTTQNPYVDRLNLSKTQQQQLQALKNQNQSKMQNLHAKMQQQDANISKQRETKADSTALLASYQQKQAIIDEMITLNREGEKQFMAILTPEQQLQVYQTYDNLKEQQAQQDKMPMQPKSKS